MKTYILLALVLLLIGCVEIQKYELSNQAVLLTKSLPGSNLIAIDALVHDGLADESTPGIRNFIQTLLVKGTTKHNATELALILDQIGSFGAATGEDHLELQFKVPKENFEAALELLSEFLTEAIFPEEEIEKERVRILEAIKTQEDNPTEALSNRLLEQLYPGHPYGRDALGTKDSVQKITREDLLQYYKTHYTAPRLIISIVGSINASVKEQVETKLGGLPINEPVISPLPTPKPKLGKGTHLEKDITDNWIGIGYPAPKVTDSDRLSVAMLNSVLGGSMGARLFTNLRDKQGLAYSVGSTYAPLESQGHLILYIGTHPHNQEKALKGLLLEAKKLREEPPDDEEFAQALNKTLGNFMLNHETVLDQAAYLARYEALGLGYEYDEKLPEELKKVTPKDVQLAAQKYLKKGTAVIVGPR